MQEIIKEYPEMTVEKIIFYLFRGHRIYYSKNFKKFKNKNLEIGYFPLGSGEFTGEIQALGYKILGKTDKNKLLLIFSQSDSPKKILFANQEIGTHLGYKRKIGENEVLKKNIVETTKEKKYYKKLIQQLNFIRVLTNFETIIPLFIGTEVSQKSINMILNDQELKEQYSTIFFENLSSNKTLKETLNTDNNILEKLEKQKINTNDKKKFPLLYIFDKLCKTREKKVQITSYTNSKYIEKDYPLSIGFTVIFA